MTEPRVSFVVTVYNKAAYLPDVLAAIGCQEGLGAREYIFIDDGSTDDSPAILEQATRTWDHVRIERQDNRGVTAATNRGLSLARQPLVKLVDADDVLLPSATRLLAEAATGTGAALAFGETASAGGPGGAGLATQAPPRPRLLDDPLRAAIRHCLFTPSAALMTRDAVARCGGCDPRVGMQDASLGLRLARIGRVARLDAVLAVAPPERRDPDRLTANVLRCLTEENRALGYFLSDYPDLAADLRQFAAYRALGRTVKYLRRHRHPAAQRLRLYGPLLRSRAGRLRDPAAVIMRTVKILEGCARGT